MKKLLSIIFCLTTILSLMCVPVLASAVPQKDANKITIRVVDKNNVAVANARVILPNEVRWTALTEYTDKNGEMRLYERKNYKSTDTKIGKYSVSIIMRKPNAKPIKEVVVVDLESKKVDSVTIIKLKNEDTKADVFKATNRTDIYVKNSKGGPVRNMKVTLYPSQVPQTIANSTDDIYSSELLTGYTDNDGRVTFLKVPVEDYTVTFSWLGGSSENSVINLTKKTGVSEFNLQFDETLLEKN